MNRYTTEDFEELGNIATEICCEKKSNPFPFKKFQKNKGLKKDDEDNDNSKSKIKPKFKNKKSKTEEVDESYLVEFDENQGIPWEPINEGSPGWDGFDTYDGEYGPARKGEPDPNYEDDPFAPPPPVKKRRLPGEVETIDDDDMEPETDDLDSDEDDDRSDDNVIKSEADMETEEDNAYDGDPDEMEMLRKTAYSPYKKKLNQAMDAADGDEIPTNDGDETPESDDSQADENGVGVETVKIKYPITIKYTDGYEQTYDSSEGEDGITGDEIVDNLKSEHSDTDGDFGILEINGIPAEEWAEQHGIEGVIPAEAHIDNDDTEGVDSDKPVNDTSSDFNLNDIDF